ncbi:hypothetical protein JOC85_003858 [Bacillus mesophilus]|uniref:Uncharacterized protein n=1 Tax=Bacillus mesophilus TaxID=1808955 RepID=A0A6M0QBL6_9BACI|nr:hypothetical protein [Bacillus mesophilus]MBM7663032.1 hypothetical protein [Bacillus mesophilus]NEY73647.1 hypothetical protein [Bacillus mesophilus]
MSRDEGHLTNEVLYVTNEEYVNSAINHESAQDEEFEEKVQDSKIRLDLYKH